MLKDAGKKDPVMQQVQNGFTLPLSTLVIYDSQVHSGGILMLLRKRFPEKTPKNGGDEKIWIEQYVNARRDWLANHSTKILHKTVYRMDCFKNEMTRNNWDLSLLPINANGVKVFG